MLYTSLLPGFPTMKHQSVKKKKKKKPVSDEDLGVNFQHGAWGRSCGDAITRNGTRCLILCTGYADCTPRQPQNFSFEIEASFLRTKQFSRNTKNYFVLARGLCVYVLCIQKGENAFLQRADAPRKDNINTLCPIA